jgi:AraC family transcriptional regulator
VSGTFEETLGRRRLTVSPATLIGRPAGEVHANRYGSTPAHCLIIELRPETVARLKDVMDLLEQSFVMEAVFVTVTAHRIRAELRRHDAVTPLVMESLVHELVAEAYRARSRCNGERRRTPWLDRTLELLRGCTDGRGTVRIGLTEVAAQVGVHPCHLARVFRREFGCSVGEYVRLHRLEEAARLLRTGTVALSSIAFATGFADQSHFTTAFRRRFGMTPGQFRRLAAGK